MANILAIDPGPIETGWVLMDEETLRPIECGKDENEGLLQTLNTPYWRGSAVIERVAAYGMRVGQEVFDTAWWAGRFYEGCASYDSRHMLFRREVKLHICGRNNVKDADIAQALIDRFAYGEKNRGKGTKDAPGWFRGFSKDIWQAYALGVTFAETVGAERSSDND